MRRRILAAIVGVATVAVLVFAIPLALTVRDLTLDDELNELERSASLISRAVEPESVAATADPALSTVHSEFRVGVYDAHGQLIAGSGPRRIDPDLRGALRGRIVRKIGASLRVSVPVGVNPATGAVRATTRARGVNGGVLQAWLILAGFAVLAVGAAAILAWTLSRRLDLPLTRLANAARRIGDGDFTSRAPRSGVPEIDGVAEAMDATAARLGDALDRERSFSSDVSHQLRTRVTGLRVTLEAAAITHADEHGTIMRAIDETDRLEATIAELLALARDTDVDRAPLDIGPLLEELAHQWRHRLATAHRVLRIDVEPLLPQASGSAVAVRQVLDVLIDNAIKHGTGDIRIVGRATGDGIAIDVANDGPGIVGEPAALFERRSSGGDGHGIGLSLARSLAEAEGGRLVLSRHAPGAQFTLLLAPAVSD